MGAPHLKNTTKYAHAATQKLAVCLGSDEARSDWSWTLSAAIQTDVPKSSCPATSTTDHEVVLCATHVTGSHHGDWDGNVPHVNLKPGECFDEASHRKPRNVGGYKAPSNVNCRMPAGIQANVPQHHVPRRLLLSPWVAIALTPYKLYTPKATS